jgi:cytochrome c oxidase subunit IV
MSAGAAGPGPAAVAHKKAPNYYLIWVFLGVLTLAEIGVAFLSGISKMVLILILIALAVWKALLVAMYYMHLKFEPKKLWWVAAAPLPLAVILVVIVLMERW